MSDIGCRPEDADEDCNGMVAPVGPGQRCEGPLAVKPGYAEFAADGADDDAEEDDDAGRRFMLASVASVG